MAFTSDYDGQKSMNKKGWHLEAMDLTGSSVGPPGFFHLRELI